MDNYFFIFSSFTCCSYLSLCHFYTQIQPQFCPFEYEKCQAHFQLPQNLPFLETTYKESSLTAEDICHHSTSPTTSSAQFGVIGILRSHDGHNGG